MKKPSGPRFDEPEHGLVDIAAIDQLAQIVVKYGLSEVEIDLGEFHVRLAREQGQTQSEVSLQAAAAAAACGPSETIAETAAEPAAADLAGAVKSPMVGTAYLRPSPEAKPFVEVGSMVKAGDKLMLVEAMKTFNDIVATRAGKIVDILVMDGSPVEYGQTLMVIE
ncbi:MAG: acetyl-CoA carboxylase biotin carboxyl carrier protein [Hyphomicrobiales bacterium]|nr:acetyl-CoA carboxylase biotin carboxyl carrier protein [Hyphomicrobiales bacterium]MBV8439059.1 acetyl-CoA carboxylase biotin carboxyl carrier protein [Hyphomicrobiales bacterium]